MPEKEYLVPFAYERYGHIAVRASSREDAFREAQEKLDRMTVSEMEAGTEYLMDSAELDYEANLLDGDGNIVEEDEGGPC